MTLENPAPNFKRSLVLHICHYFKIFIVFQPLECLNSCWVLLPALSAKGLQFSDIPRLHTSEDRDKTLNFHLETTSPIDCILLFICWDICLFICLSFGIV